MLRLSRRVWVLALGVVLVASGCRTYGGYNSDAKIYDALQTTVQSFEEMLDRAETDLGRLEEAAANVDALGTSADDFRNLVQEHETILQRQRERIERLSPTTGYRELREAYGATVTEQRMIEQRYRRALRAVEGTVRATTVGDVSEQSLVERYTVRPVGFPREGRADSVSLEQVLQGL